MMTFLGNMPHAVWWVLVAGATLMVIVLIFRWLFQLYNVLVGQQEEIRNGRRSLEASKEKLDKMCEHIRVLLSSALGLEAHKYVQLAIGRKGSPGEWRWIIEAHAQELWGFAGLREAFRQYEQLYNEVSYEKKRLSALVMSYNHTVRSFPGILVAMLFGMEAIDQEEDDEAHLSDQFDHHPAREDHPLRRPPHDIYPLPPSQWGPDNRAAIEEKDSTGVVKS